MALNDLLHSQVAIFGEIDAKVKSARLGSEAKDVQIVQLVEAMMPGSTGFGQAGWLDDLTVFLNGPTVPRPRHNGRVEFPGFADAVESVRGAVETTRVKSTAPTSFATESSSEPKSRPLSQSTFSDSESRAAEPPPEAPAAEESPPQPPDPGSTASSRALQLRRTFYEADRDPVLARTAYAAVVLYKIWRIEHPGEVIWERRGLGDDETDNIGWLLDFLPDILEPWVADSTVLRSGIPGDPKSQAADSGITATDALLKSIDGITSRADWIRIAGDVVGKAFADTSKPCFGTLEESDGLYCSTIYTDSTVSDLSVDQIAQIVNPLNWPICSKFFAKMQVQEPEYSKTGWSRILESIGAESDEYVLDTALIFFFHDSRVPADPAKPDGLERGIFINYDLDINRQRDCGVVEVDNGYLWITPDNATDDPSTVGVRIRTSKQERINGLSPTATSALACLLGWGDAGREMLAGTARRLVTGKKGPNGEPALKPSEFKPFKTSPPDDCVGDPYAGSPKSNKRAKLPPNFQDTVEDSQKLINDLICRTTNVLGAAGSRWVDGLTPADVGEITKEIGDNLQEWSAEVYEVAERNVKPKDDVKEDAEKDLPVGGGV